MKRQKYVHNKEKSIKSNMIFCAECGEELDMFGISGSEIDLEKIKERHKHCKEKGKFKLESEGKDPFWNHPVVIGGMFFLRHENDLFVFEVKGR